MQQERCSDQPRLAISQLVPVAGADPPSPHPNKNAPADDGTRSYLWEISIQPNADADVFHL